jgi:hypothetical protein
VTTDSRERTRAARRARRGRAGGGTRGNARLTGSTAVILLAMLFVEGITVLFLQPLFSVHVFVGMLLIPPIALKLASTGYRFARYYTNDLSYRHEGPPQIVLRVIAPFVVLTTLAVFGTGVALLVLGPRDRWLVGWHKASFIAWFFLMSLHVLAYLTRLPGLASADWSRGDRLGGSLQRRGLVAGAIVAGVALAAVTLPMADPWFSQLSGGR